MSLTQDIKVNLKESLKSRDALKAETLRSILAAIHNKEIEKRGKEESELTDEEIIDVLRKEAKKRKEAIEIYGKAGRKDLEDKEIKELEIIKIYLPPELGREEIEGVVKKIIVHGETNFGAVMKAVMQELAGRAEARIVSEIVKKNLEK